MLLGDSFPHAAPCSGAAIPWWSRCPARGKVLAQRAGDPKLCVGGAHGRPILLYWTGGKIREAEQPPPKRGS